MIKKSGLNLNRIIFIFSLLFIKGILYGVSTQTLNIAASHHLNTGQYLLPASMKISISNWLNPTFEDYKQIQRYLDSDRPELRYLNFPGSTWREERIRNFKLITNEINPSFGIAYLNDLPDDKRNCIITYVSCDEAYIQKLHSLFDALKTIGFNGHFIFRIGGWPATEEGSLELFDVPYAFKIFSFLEAKNLGYKNCLWLDSCMLPKKKLDPIFKNIENTGVFFYSLSNYSSKFNIKNFVAQSLGTTIEKFLKMAPITTIAVGLDLTNEKSLCLLNEWYQMAKEKLGFLSFIPEMAPIYVLAHKLKLVPFAKSLNYPYKGIPDSEGILVWDHD